MSDVKFRVTKKLLADYCEKGFTVKKIAGAITELSGKPCSEGVVRKAAKQLGINLRNKPKESNFEIVEDDEMDEETNSITLTTFSA